MPMVDPMLPGRVVGYHHWCGVSHEAFTPRDLLTQERACEHGPMARHVPPPPHSPEQCPGCLARLNLETLLATLEEETT